jgi:hypothetical protein
MKQKDAVGQYVLIAGCGKAFTPEESNYVKKISCDCAQTHSAWFPQKGVK